MIDDALAFLADKLNAHLLFEFGLPNDVVHLGPMPPAQSRPTAMLILYPVHVGPSPRVLTPGADPATAQDQRLHILVAADFDTRFTDGLAQLSAAIGYFDTRPRFGAETTPPLPAGIESLSISWQDIDLATQAALWGSLGRSYLPSALFEVHIHRAPRR